jgi:hypothetical protein
MWLMKDYLPEVGERDSRIFPDADRLAAWLGGALAIQTIPIHRDSPDCDLRELEELDVGLRLVVSTPA